MGEKSIIWIAIALIAACTGLLATPVLLPNLADVGWDDFLYIESGRQLTQGTLPHFSQNPLVASSLALAYLPVHNSPYWLLQQITIFRVVVFLLIFSAAIALALQINKHAPLWTAAILLLLPSMALVLQNASDALFAATSGFALVFALRFLDSKKNADIALASGWLALAALSRNDGLPLFVCFGLFVIVLAVKKLMTPKAIAWAVAPFLVIAGGYVLLFGLTTGDWRWGVSERTYTAFEQGQGAAFAADYGSRNEFFEGVESARALYGSPEENEHSVLRAIAKNPGAYAKRLIRISTQLPFQIIAPYKGQEGILLFALAILSIVLFALEKRWLSVLLVAIWPAHLLVYLITFYRIGYFLLPMCMLVALAAAGFAKVVSDEKQKKILLIMTVVISGLGTLGFLLGRPKLAMAAVFVIAMSWIVSDCIGRWGQKGAVAFAVCLAMLVTAMQWDRVKVRKLGQAQDEAASLFMANQFPEKARIASYTPGNVIFAKKQLVPIYRYVDQVDSTVELAKWMISLKVDAIYVNRTLRQFEPEFYNLITSQVGNNLEVAFGSLDDDVTVLVPRVIQGQ